MRTQHTPTIGPRFWTAIIGASILGTNLGDLYAHDIALGVGRGLLLLAALFAVICIAEQRDRSRHEAWYWLAIIVIRTGATNIADFLAYRVHVPATALLAGLACVIAAAAPRQRGEDDPEAFATALPRTGPGYWTAMLAAGVFGTVGGDVAAHAVGQGLAAVMLGLPFAALVVALRHRAAPGMAATWCMVALARTAGTCIGDWLAEGSPLHLGLARSTLLSGTAFVMVLVFWPATRSARADRRTA